MARSESSSQRGSHWYIVTSSPGISTKPTRIGIPMWMSAGSIPTRLASTLHRRGFIPGFYLWGITLKVDRRITTALLERLGTAVDDHHAFDGVGS